MSFNKKILIFGGTSEGRKLGELLSKKGFLCHISVATDYGEMLLEETSTLKILKGRLNEEQINELIKKENYDLVIDGTHPFAKIVSENIYNCAEKNAVQLLRFERKTQLDSKENWHFVENSEEALKFLKKTQGNILLTTGSKDLNVFCSDEKVKERLIVRVLPAMESLKLCYDNKLDGRQIICMQGPFSKKMNETQIEDYKISVLVTKESGNAGGIEEKLSAALEKGINCLIIKNLNSKDNSSKNYQKYKKFQEIYEIFAFLEDFYKEKFHFSTDLEIYLLGIGMGNEEYLSQKTRNLIENANYIFGAERMLKIVDSLNTKEKVQKYPYYLAKDIIPKFREIQKQAFENEKICVLFSGDTGFYSGTEKLYKELKKEAFENVEIIPGLSSLSYLAAKLKISYEDAYILSLHGINMEQWKENLRNLLGKEKKIFMLSSGCQDLLEVAQILKKYNEENKNLYKLAYGFQLSYSDEKIQILDPQNIMAEGKKESGLYSFFVIME